MKNLKAPIAAMLLFIAFTSCKKDLNEDVQFSEEVTSSETTPPTAEDFSKAGWQTASEWKSVQQPSHTVYFSNMEAGISAEDAEAGMVRVFKIAADGSSSQSLPFEETANDTRFYWYYQITEGNILLAVDVYGAKENPAQNSLFNYVVVEKDQLTNFESEGTSRSELMDMSFQQMQSIQK